MKQITSRGKTIEIPSELSELTPGQYSYYCHLWIALASGAISIEYYRIRWYSFLLGMGASDYTILMRSHIEELEQQMSVIDNFLIYDDNGAHPTFDTAKNLLPEYLGYHGPQDMFQDVSFEDFVECYTIAETIDQAAPDEIASGYDRMARILYHIPDDHTVPHLLTLHSAKLFTSVCNIIMRGPVDINGKKIDLRIIFKRTGSTQADDKTGWMGVTFEIASAGLFGPVDRVGKANMWEILLYLYKCKFEYLHEKNNLSSRR